MQHSLDPTQTLVSKPEIRPPDNRESGNLPLVSVLTPTFNQARWLTDCLNSVQAQTYPRVEHVVVNDGSTDGTLEILERAENSVVWTSQPNRGQSNALNRAFAASHGDIIGWLNSDDAYYEPNVIARVVEAFDKDPDVDVVYGHSALVNDEGLLLHVMWAPTFNAILLQRETFIIQPTAFIRRSALRGRFVDESYDYCMDRELWLRLAPTCKFTRLPNVLAIDRHHLSRKGETMGQVAKVESARLRKQYGFRRGNGGLPFKLYRIAKRGWGLTLIPTARKGPFAFSAVSDGMLKLVVRQVATPRRWMPTG
jgi:glycosyltransferase involved in cell wall biosynthesis